MHAASAGPIQAHSTLMSTSKSLEAAKGFPHTCLTVIAPCQAALERQQVFDDAMQTIEKLHKGYDQRCRSPMIALRWAQRPRLS